MTRRLVPLVEVAGKEGYEWATERWLRRQVAAHRLPRNKAVGKVLIDLDDLDALVEQGRVEADPSASHRRGHRRRTSSR